MKRINALLKKAKKISETVVRSIFSQNEDGFLEALGVNPSMYEVKQNVVLVGYDCMRALKDIVDEVWSNEE